MRALVGIGIALQIFVLSCSSFDKRSRSTTIRRDVPYQARKSFLAEPRKRVLILPIIDVEKSSSPAVSRYARDVFIRKLLSSDQFIVIRNEDFPKDIAGFRIGDTYDLEKMGQAAAGLGLAAIVEGKILKIKAKRVGDEVGLVRKIKAQMEATIQVRVLGTENKKVLFNETRSAIVEDSVTRLGKYSSSDRFLRDDPQLVRSAVSKAFHSMVPMIVASVQKLSWEGRIAQINGDKVYINAGRLSGIQVGDILKVVDSGRDVYDPKTGEFIGHAPGHMKGTLEVVSYFGKDGAIAVIHSGNGFKELDRVEVY